MVSGTYSFIDIAVLDPVRGRLAAGDAMAILDIGLDRLIWANGPGAAFFGHSDVESVMGAQAGLSAIARRQIAAAPGFPRMRREMAVMVRLGGTFDARPTGLTVSSVTLPDGEPAILLALPAVEDEEGVAGEVAHHAVSGFANADSFAALVDAEGGIESASEGFAELGIAPSTLAELVEEVRDEADRLVKRLIPASEATLAAGIARLTDDPARHLLLVVEAEVIDEAGEGEVEPETLPTPEAGSEPVEEAPGDVGRKDESLLEPDGESTETAVSTSPQYRDVTRMGREAAAGVEAGRGAGREQGGPAVPHDRKGAVRFVWRTDAEGRFTTISEEFASAVGLEEGAVAGKTFREVAKSFGLDAGGEIANLLERRDTWSGRTVLWPVAGAGFLVPVDLAALPIYDRVRNFEGFRGFGVARLGDAVLAPDAEEAAAGQEAPDEGIPDEDPFRGETPVIAVGPAQERRQSDKIIRLAEHRAANGNEQAAAEDKGLSDSERSAFRQIGERLKREGASGPADDLASRTAAPANDDVSTRRESQEAAGEALPESVAAEPAQPVTAIGLDELEPAPELESHAFPPSAFPASQVAAADPDTMTALLGGLPYPVLVHAGDRLHFANREFLRLVGHESLESIAAIGGIGALFVDGVDPAQATGALRLQRPDGIELDVSAHLQSVAWNGGKALLLALKPMEPGMPEAKPARDDLEARLDEMRAIIDTATDGVVLIDNDGNIRSISRPAEALFGTDSARLEGQPFTSLFAMESQRSAGDYLAGLADNGVASVLNDGREVIGREAQGRFIPLFMTMGRLPGDGGYCAVLRDITSWKRAEDELTQARAQAERASSQKTEFLARVSHEVRTPLNAIIGFSELMLDEKFGPVGNERYRDYLRDINRSGNHVLDLVNDLLDISKIEAGEQEMSHEAVPLNDTLAETVAMMQPQANRERVIIRSSFASRLPDVVADLRSVRQIALNLLSNAVRHTPAGGQVIVSTAHEQSGDVVVRVRDTGIGMTLSEIEQALKPFKQINALKRARGEGTGLGLPLTKALVEANRARFNISSSPGQGTMVEITFPSTRVLAD